jgi:hypothetical protein
MKNRHQTVPSDAGLDFPTFYSLSYANGIKIGLIILHHSAFCAKVGNFTSYCRCAPTQLLSDGKSKGSGNRKNGNRYLSWAFSEAAHLARRYNDRFRRYYNRKAAQTNTIVATRALSNKLARICYYIMRDQVVFNEELILH